MKITNHLEEVSFFESTADCFRISNPNIKVVQGLVSSIDTERKVVHIEGLIQGEGKKSMSGWLLKERRRIIVSMH